MDQPLQKPSLLQVGQIFEQAAFLLLLLLASTFAFELTQPLISTGPVSLTNVETVAILMISFWLLSHLSSRKPVYFPRPLGLSAAAWFLIFALSTILAPLFHEQALLFMGRILAGILISLAVYNLAAEPKRQLLLIFVLAAGVTAVAFLGLAEAFNIFPLAGWLDNFKLAPTRVGDLLRVSSTLSYSTIAAMVLELFLPLVLVLVLVARRRIWRIAGALGVFTMLSAHVLTLSRGGSLSLFLALLVMAVAGLYRGWRRITAASLLTAAVFLILMLLVAFLQPAVRLRLSTETDQFWYRAKFDVPQEVVAKPGERVAVPLVISNDGRRGWDSEGVNFFALSYHLNSERGESVTYEGERTPLPRPLAPGDEMALEGLILAPPEPGVYTIEWDMVQEAVTWFSWKDAPTALSRLVVQGDPVGEFLPPDVAPPTDVTIIKPTPGRLVLWSAAVAMFLDYPLLGVGPDNFRWQYGSYANLEVWNTGIHANNLYIELLADSGILGVIVFLWFSWELLRLGLSKVRDQYEERPWLLALGLAAGLAAWYVHGLFDYFFEFSPTYVAFWLLLGLLASYSISERAIDESRI